MHERDDAVDENAEADGDIRVVDRPSAPNAGSVRVGGVLLAAGSSERFGARNKLLAPVDDVPLVRRAAESFAESCVDPVVVVVGHDAAATRDALDGLDVRVVANDAYETGQSSSVRVGIRALADRGVDAAVIGLGDMPFVRPETITRLVAAYAEGAGDALAAAFDGARGNPVLFAGRYFPALTDRDGDVGGKAVFFGAERPALVETGDPGVRRDIDRPQDLPASERESDGG
ncbi:nucleotidyltransferase family protein [Haloferacaceae archaeon DSL9]